MNLLKFKLINCKLRNYKKIKIKYGEYRIFLNANSHNINHQYIIEYLKNTNLILTVYDNNNKIIYKEIVFKLNEKHQSNNELEYYYEIVIN